MDVAGIAATTHDVVIVGSRGSVPMAWTSRAGGPWAAGAYGPERAYPGTIVAFGDRMLVVGGTDAAKCGGDFASVFSVRAADGRWTTGPFEDFFCGAGGGPVALSEAGAAVLNLRSTDEKPYAWFSEDGLKWVEHPVRQDIIP